MKIELITITVDAEKIIEESGRTCYKSKLGNAMIIRNWIRSGHTSVVEHASATFRISGVSRAFSHQLVRHRIASYSQMSQRYTSSDNFPFVIPNSIDVNDTAFQVYDKAMCDLRVAYAQLIELGIPKEDARMLLPNACCTEIVATMNFRSLRNFFQLRLDAHSQWEIRAVANEMLKIVKPLAPNVFFDFEVTNEINN